MGFNLNSGPPPPSLNFELTGGSGIKRGALIYFDMVDEGGAYMKMYGSLWWAGVVVVGYDMGVT
jgi:hypothetical protein